LAEGLSGGWLTSPSEVSKREHVVLVDVHSGIANIYGKLVLKQQFTKKSENILETDKISHISLDINHLFLLLFLTKEQNLR